MKMLKTIIIIVAILLSLPPIFADGNRYGMIICARSGSRLLFEANRTYAKQSLELMEKAGIARASCFIEGGAKTIPGAAEPSRKLIAAKLKKLAGKLTANDEFWLFIYGHANYSGKRLSIATSGGRMSGNELAVLVRAVPCKKFIFCFNRQGFILFEKLCGKDNFAVSATNGPNQLNPPLLPEYLLPVWLASPGKPFISVLKQAVAGLDGYFNKNKLAISERAVISENGKLYQYPFRIAAGPETPDGFIIAGKSGAETSRLESEKPVLSIADLPKPHPSTPETLAIIAKAGKAAKVYPGYPVVGLDQHIEYTVSRDNRIRIVETMRIYYPSADGAARYATEDFIVPRNGPELKLGSARIVYPDGSFRYLKPEVFVLKSGGFLYRLRYPGLTAGCVTIREVSCSYPSPGDFPLFCRNVTLGKAFPVLHPFVGFRIPGKRDFRFRVLNAKAVKQELPEPYGKSVKFNFASFPACESLPYDPPKDEFLPRILISEASDWNIFVKWYRTILAGTEKLDPATEKLTRQLCGSAADDTDKVRRIYDFLCNLRYETVPLGVGGFRPRTPGEVCREKYGDCKDKANALVAMAKAAGITGSLALVKRGGQVDTAFPAWQFNHALVYFPKLPGHPDGLWCDPTDTSTPFGTLPPGDTGCKALVLAPGKAEFMTVVPAKSRHNLIRQEIVFKVLPDSHFTGTVTFRVSGLQDYLLRKKFRGLTPEQEKFLAQELVNACFRGGQVNGITHTQVNSLNRTFTVTIAISGNDWKLARNRINSPFDFWSPFSAPDRPRQLYLNYGQPFRVEQSVKVSGGELPGGNGKWRGENSSLALEYNQFDQGKSREIAAEVRSARISPGNYRECFRLVEKWYVKFR